MKNIVTVKSKSVNNRAVPVEFQTVELDFGGRKDTRTLSRSYVFQNFEAQIPLQMARILVKQQPKEFWIEGQEPKEETTKEKTAKDKIKVSKDKQFKCPYCDYTVKAKIGLYGHVRGSHKEKWEEFKKLAKKDNFN